MSKLPYRFITPIPIIFERNGVLDPKKQSYKNRLAFLKWAFSKCHYDRFNFSCNRLNAAKESGLTEEEWRAQEKFFIENGFLIKKKNPIHDRPSLYEWSMEKICEDKIILFEEQPCSKPCLDDEEKKPPAILREEINQKPPAKNMEKVQPNPQPNPHVYKNDNKTIESLVSLSDNTKNIRARQNLSLSYEQHFIASFNEKSYRLRNGNRLSSRMVNSIGKYSSDERERLIANVLLYEKHMDEGRKIKFDAGDIPNHERYLQWLINKDIAKKNENIGINNLTAMFYKEEYKIHKMEIFQTSITLPKNSNELPMSIKKELPPRTFNAILENYINNYINQRLEACGTN